MSDEQKRDAVLDRYSGNGWDYPDHEAMAWRIVELEATIERVRALHTPVHSVFTGHMVCDVCRELLQPCPTIRALEETP